MGVADRSYLNVLKTTSQSAACGILVLYVSENRLGERSQDPNVRSFSIYVLHVAFPLYCMYEYSSKSDVDLRDLPDWGLAVW